MATYNLSADELLLIYLTFLARDEENHSEYFTKWFNNGGSSQLRSLFNSLKDKGIIHKNYNPETYVPNDIEFSKTFIKGWIKNSGELGQELFDNYTPFVNINGKLCSLRNISKQFNSLDDFFFHYSSAIGHDVEKHEKVMELLKWGKENNKIHYSILEFVNSRKWLDLELLKNSNIEGQVEDSFNVYESI